MAEYIEREAVIADLKEQVEKGREKGRDTAECEAAELVIQRFAEYIKSFPAADVQPIDRWISVDETLPVYNSRVLVYDVSKNIRIGIYTEIGWCSQYENPLMYKVTHWQPLPEPPEAIKG